MPQSPPHEPDKMLDQVLAAFADPEQPRATFVALDQMLQKEPGHILFTILVHHPAARQTERFYSNQPEAYPVGGRKPVTDSPWMQRVMTRGEPYIGYTREDIAANFYDHDLIHSLGCESILNMPIRWCGQTLGTLNLCHRAGHYTEAHLSFVRLAAQLALPGVMALNAVSRNQ
jgi:GAF domain-containing protein